MHTDLTKGSIRHTIVRLALPAIVGYFFHTLFNVTDTFFAGLISTQALAALSLSSSVFFMILALGIGMSEAVTALVGNALGKRQIAQARHIALNALFFALLLSVALSLIGILSVPYLVEALSDPSYTEIALEYLYLILYGIVFFMGAFFSNALLNATGDTSSFRNVLIFTSLLNILLDYLCIYLLGMGVYGIALATILSEAVVCVYLFLKVRQTRLWVGLGDFRYDGALIVEILKQGLPPSVNMFMIAFGMYIITYFIAPFGKEAVAGLGLGMRIEQIFLLPIIGISVATLSIISQNNGASRYERITPTIRLAIFYGWIISTVGIFSFFLFADYFASLLTTDSGVVAQTTLYLRVCGFASYGFVVIFISISLLQGLKRPAVVIPVSLYRQVFAPIPVFMVLAWLQMDIVTFWIGIDVIVFSSALFLWWYSRKTLSTLPLKQ